MKAASDSTKREANGGLTSQPGQNKSFESLQKAPPGSGFHDAKNTINSSVCPSIFLNRNHLGPRKFFIDIHFFRFWRTLTLNTG
jgi:hypothetical protein